jgi:hypothetical protein
MRWLVCAALIVCGGSDATSSELRTPSLVVQAPTDAVIDAPPAWRSCLLDGPTPCLSLSPVSVKHGVIAWSDWLAGYGTNHVDSEQATECRWVAELANVLLCASYDRGVSNQMFVRPSIFIEGLRVPAGTVVKRSSFAYLDNIRRAAGFDLLKKHPSGTHPDLVGYFAALDRACKADPEQCADAPEQAIRDLLERAWAGRSSFVVIAYAIHGMLPDDMVISHEILHAQYFTDPKFRGIVDAYWAELPEVQRKVVRDRLGTFYNAKDDELMRNELMAYVLMSSTGSNPFADLVEPHRDALMARMRAQGIQPVQTELRAVTPAEPDADR